MRSIMLFLFILALASCQPTDGPYGCNEYKFQRCVTTVYNHYTCNDPSQESYCAYDPKTNRPIVDSMTNAHLRITEHVDELNECDAQLEARFFEDRLKNTKRALIKDRANGSENAAWLIEFNEKFPQTFICTDI